MGFILYQNLQTLLPEHCQKQWLFVLHRLLLFNITGA